MKKRIAIIDIGWAELNEKNTNSLALGGSETWLVQISKAFAKDDNSIEVYCNCRQEFLNYGVHFYPKKFFFNNGKTYDFVILNRIITENRLNYIDYIKHNRIAKHVYLQMHDLSIMMGSHIVNDQEITKYIKGSDDFLTIVMLNPWHAENLKRQYSWVPANIICIPNGIDPDLFDYEEPGTRDNRVLWSSCEERGLDILVNEIYPEVKKQVPDFGIDIAGYNMLRNNYGANGNDIKYLGKLSKKELYEEQRKHKCWFYPGTFIETFCITLIENMVNGVFPVSTFTGGMKDVIDGIDKNLYETRVHTRYNQDRKAFIEESVEKIVEILKNGKNYTGFENVKKKIKDVYNWDNSVKKYIEDFDSLENHDKKAKAHKILMLTMSCNLPYFKSLLGAVKDTWAKPLLKDEYDDIIWFAYTACDEYHPYPYIDFENHIIYVDHGDSLNETYGKTKKAYEMLKATGIKFDYVVRTNTSVFVNIENLRRLVYETNAEHIIGGTYDYFHIYNSGKSEFMWKLIPGLFFGMPYEIFDSSMDTDDNFDTIPAPDDVIISGRLSQKYKEMKVYSPNRSINSVFPRYKAVLPEHKQNLVNDAPQMIYDTDDPRIVQSCVCVKVKSDYRTIKERSEYGHEIEHFYELQQAMV